ncbi:hypothetical protein [Nocardioides sp. SYSU DS0651]|uniref:hypothetical protein n=1 Tax=Nocardioides sp. SYSU DS0651 TaxID=3415955 RepID=UPI003F4C8517
MPWTWERLHAAITALGLPEGEYVAGLAAAMLANESVASADEVDLLVTDDLYVDLAGRGWDIAADQNRLACPGETGLLARAGDVSDGYTAPIRELISEAWRQDGIPLVSVLQVHQAAVRAFLKHEPEPDGPAPSPSWTWSRLRTAVPRLELPAGQYVVGLAGALLANETLEQVAEVEVLVTPELLDGLAGRDWFGDDARAVLHCPIEDDLVARSGDVGDAYSAPIPRLVAEAWHQEGIPFVSMEQVRADAVRAALRSDAGLSG